MAWVIEARTSGWERLGIWSTIGGGAVEEEAASIGGGCSRSKGVSEEGEDWSRDMEGRRDKT